LHDLILAGIELRECDITHNLKFHWPWSTGNVPVWGLRRYSHNTDSQHPAGLRVQSLGLLFVLIVGLVAGTISGIVGTGSSIMLTPVRAKGSDTIPSPLFDQFH
jgi:hypothetical protein